MKTIFHKVGLIASGFFGLGFTALALITLLPAEASKPNLLGYYGVCSWAPNSTASLIILTGISLVIAARFNKKMKTSAQL